MSSKRSKPISYRLQIDTGSQMRVPREILLTSCFFHRAYPLRSSNDWIAGLGITPISCRGQMGNHPRNTIQPPIQTTNGKEADAMIAQPATKLIPSRIFMDFARKVLTIKQPGSHRSMLLSSVCPTPLGQAQALASPMGHRTRTASPWIGRSVTRRKLRGNAIIVRACACGMCTNLQMKTYVYVYICICYCALQAPLFRLVSTNTSCTILIVLQQL